MPGRGREFLRNGDRPRRRVGLDKRRRGGDVGGDWSHDGVGRRQLQKGRYIPVRADPHRWQMGKACDARSEKLFEARELAKCDAGSANLGLKFLAQPGCLFYETITS